MNDMGPGFCGACSGAAGGRVDPPVRGRSIIYMEALKQIHTYVYVQCSYSVMQLDVNRFVGALKSVFKASSHKDSILDQLNKNMELYYQDFYF